MVITSVRIALPNFDSRIRHRLAVYVEQAAVQIADLSQRTSGTALDLRQIAVVIQGQFARVRRGQGSRLVSARAGRARRQPPTTRRRSRPSICGGGGRQSLLNVSNGRFGGHRCPLRSGLASDAFFPGTKSAASVNIITDTIRIIIGQCLNGCGE